MSFQRECIVPFILKLGLTNIPSQFGMYAKESVSRDQLDISLKSPKDTIAKEQNIQGKQPHRVK